MRVVMALFFLTTLGGCVCVCGGGIKKENLVEEQETNAFSVFLLVFLRCLMSACGEIECIHLL